MLEGVLWKALGFIGAILAALHALATPFVRGLTEQANVDYPNMPLTADQCAVGVVKHAIDHMTAAEEARLSGYDAARFDTLITMTGNPPGPETLMTMWNRRIIDEEGVRRGLHQGILRDDWTDNYLKLQTRVLTGAEVVEAAVQNHLGDAEARRRWEMADGDPADYDIAYATHGNPPGVQEMLFMWRRGKLTEAEVIQGIRESRLKDKYIKPMMEMAEYLPPARTVTTLLAHGAIDTMRAHQLFQANGLSDEMATAYVASAMHTKTATQKELTVGQVTALYADGILTREQGLADLHKVGFGDPEANLILDLAEAKAEQQVRTHAIGRVRAMYLAHKTDLGKAQADLAKLGVDAAQTQRLLTVWEIEQAAPSKTLTLGQLNAALKDDLITKDDYLTRVISLGYDQADAELLSKIAVPPETP